VNNPESWWNYFIAQTSFIVFEALDRRGRANRIKRNQELLLNLPAMSKQILILLIGLSINITAIGQWTDEDIYQAIISESDSLYERKEYLKSGQKYSEAFSAIKTRNFYKRLYDRAAERYNAASSWAMANEPDSAFVQLFIVAHSKLFAGYSDRVAEDDDMISLHGDSRWAEFIKILKANDEKFNKDLSAKLDTIYVHDQKYRIECMEMNEAFGEDSEEGKSACKVMHETDSINLMEVEKILDEHGWLGADEVGASGNTALWLVIQHSSQEVQEKYLPMMREAVSEGKALPCHLALLEDRVNVRQGKKQMYGSQPDTDPETGEYCVSSLEDPDNVDERRLDAGLDKLGEYMSQWGVTWNIEEYKKKVAEDEAKLKK
jgi:hypothetical protein